MKKGGLCEVVRGTSAYLLTHSGSTALRLRLLGVRNSLHSMCRMNAASDSARRPLCGTHPFGKCGAPSLRANREQTLAPLGVGWLHRTE